MRAIIRVTDSEEKYFVPKPKKQTVPSSRKEPAVSVCATRIGPSTNEHGERGVNTKVIH